MSNDFDKLLEEGFALLLGKDQREHVWKAFIDVSEAVIASAAARPVFDETLHSNVDDALSSLDFSQARDPRVVLNFVVDLLARFQLNTSHPRYFGVFNPSSSTMGMVAEALTALFNPQLASSTSSKACIAIEDHLLHYFSKRFGYQEDTCEGSFTTGASEANYTALLCALQHSLPRFREHGLASAKGVPMVYCSSETHHSVARAVRIMGLGSRSLRVINVDKHLQIDTAMLETSINEDISAGHQPLFVVGTVGSTSAGVIDPMDDIATICERYGLWFHVDAAWGGAIALLDEYASVMRGCARADSIAFDPHKWLSVPMGCGMFLTRHRGVMRRTFDVDESPYMPESTRVLDTTEPYRQSLQWSRRFIGLKLFMTLMVHGDTAYQATLRHQIYMGELLKAKLAAHQWRVVNETPLPVLCFIDLHGCDVESLRRDVIATKQAFLTTTKLTFDNKKVLRAGIPNFLTQENHLDEFIGILNGARRDQIAKNRYQSL